MASREDMERRLWLRAEWRLGEDEVPPNPYRVLEDEAEALFTKDGRPTPVFAFSGQPQEDGLVLHAMIAESLRAQE